MIRITATENDAAARSEEADDASDGVAEIVMLPGIVDIQSATYDDPEAVPAMVHIQTAERLSWMERAHELPTFERYPPQT